ncbi:MAG: HYR domain-containing protein [Lewinellaceae bacterium]|nr:HYR domain-containing protein [Lewinellaceae bacterium]
MTTVTYDVADNSDNAAATCSFSVTVNDSENPTIVCPSDITTGNDAGVCGANVTYTVSYGDNCSVATLAQGAGQGSGSTFPVGTTTNTFTVTDASNNMATCSFTVTVNDTENPTIACPPNITTGSDAGVCGAVVAYTVSYGDNCPGATLAQSAGQASSSTFPVSTTTNSFTVTDASGNSAMCSFTVTVNDTQAPNAVCVNTKIPVVLDLNGEASITPALVDNNSTDNCGITSYTVVPTLLTTANVGDNTVVLTVTDAAGNSASCSSTVTINKRPTTLVYNGDFSEQYSDEADLSAILIDQLTGTFISGRTIDFSINSNTASGVTEISGTASTTVQITQDPAGTYTVDADFDGTSDPLFLSSSDSDPFDVLQEDAIATYTGTMFASTSGNNNEATISLIATIKDPDDGSRGNISYAQVQFYNGTTPIGPVLNVLLFDPNDTTAGYVQYDWTVNLNNNQESDTYEIGIEVLNYYTREYRADDALVTVSQPLNDFFTGGGYLFMEESAGTYAGDDGTKCHFSVNAKWTPNGNNPKGKVHFLVRRLESDGIVHIYRFKSNQINSIGINQGTNEGEVAGKCNIQDVTDPNNPLSLGGNKPFLVKVQDNGEPGTVDNIAITVYNNGGGGLLFSSYWNGTQSVYDLLDAGNLQVHYSNQSLAVLPSIDLPQVIEEVEGAQIKESVHLFPNPASEEIQLILTSSENKAFRIDVIDLNGKIVQRIDLDALKGENAIRLDIQDLAQGAYWVRVIGQNSLMIQQFIRM